MTSAEDQFIATALEEHFGPHKPPDLAESIIDALEADAARSRTRRPHRRWFVAAMLLAGLGTVALVPLLEVLDGAVAAQDPDGEASYMPLSVGAHWEYVRSDVVHGRIERDTVVEQATSRIRVGERDVYQILRLVGDQPEFYYFAVDSQGIWRYPAGGPRSMPGLHEDGVPVLEMVFPPTVGATWQWTLDEPVTGHTIAVGGGAPYPSTPIARKATVAAVDEEITVPAGTFSTVHLRIEITEGNRMSPNRIEHAWYAPGVGLVKTARETSNFRNPAIMTLDELTLFTPGKAPLDWELQLPTALAKHAELADRGMPDSFEPIALGEVALILESRFGIARWAGEEVVLRFGGDRLSVFDRADLEDWTELIAEEPLCAFSTGSLPQASTAALAELAGRLYAVQSGFEVTGSLQVETVNLSRGRRLIQGSLTIRSSTRERTITCRAVVDGGRAIEVSIR